MEILKNRIDIKAGKMTYGQRLTLHMIIESDKSGKDKVNSVFICLHGFIPDEEQYSELVDYFRDICDGIKYWILQESLLKYEPTLKEKAKFNRIASVKLNDKSTPTEKTINALANEYNVEPADVLNWEYKKVFDIFSNDLEKYNQEVNCSQNN